MARVRDHIFTSSLRTFDEAKAKALDLDYLGSEVDWEVILLTRDRRRRSILEMPSFILTGMPRRTHRYPKSIFRYLG